MCNMIITFIPKTQSYYSIGYCTTFVSLSDCTLVLMYCTRHAWHVAWYVLLHWVSFPVIVPVWWIIFKDRQMLLHSLCPTRQRQRILRLVPWSAGASLIGLARGCVEWGRTGWWVMESLITQTSFQTLICSLATSHEGTGKKQGCDVI